ncbi:MAG TPA: glycogen synthase GlgA [Burkholderiales bacterium]|nr:glycogen synthase GlgA [Burkholderiales bacterium]
MDLSRPLGALFVAPECAPLTKTGGLGDVCGALPPALRALGIDVRVLMPGYAEVLRAIEPRRLAVARLLGQQVRLLEAQLPNGVPLLVVDCPKLYARRGGPYLSAEGADWPDNALRFGLLCKAAALLASDASPLAWRPDVVHCNDWPAAPAAAFMRFDGAAAASLVTIHNLAFQGLFGEEWVERLGFPAHSFGIDGIEFHGRLSFLKAGLSYADAISTVSPTYAQEIQTPGFGCGLDGLLRHRANVLTGILNGIDGAVWDPRTDTNLARTYDAETLEDKAHSKAALQRAMGLPVDAAVPLLGQVGRMTAQKGADLLVESADALAAMGQVAILGTGDRALEQAFAALARRHPGRIAVRVGFDEGLAHVVEAGADIFLMPSRYEPCGLNQMYSQRYGTPPVVHATGGLADTVEDGVSGFAFRDYSAGAFLGAVGRAVRCRADARAWRAVQRAGMRRDFSWSAAARRYADLYRSLAMRARA